MKGKLKNGFKWDVDVKVLNDMELIDAVAEAESENPAKISVVIKKLLGEKQRKALYDHIRDEDGIVPADVLADCVVEIITALGEPGKN